MMIEIDRSTWSAIPESAEKYSVGTLLASTRLSASRVFPTEGPPAIRTSLPRARLNPTSVKLGNGKGITLPSSPLIRSDWRIEYISHQ